ncbi:AAA family ATPase [Rapidithrix thailandica]|uniref:AAA family ATPase n=1 Tax=Rapidithrix thailandica TaxID=413964 RepID=A0AAW9S1V6_9BACT
MRFLEKYLNENFFVITGGPGVGKTTLLDELNRKGFCCVPEVAREIIKEQMSSKGDALPWGNKRLYMQLMLERSVESYQETVKTDTSPIFFDRGILDTLCYAKLIEAEVTKEMEHYARKFRYNFKVFLLPPWKAIYQTDTERKQSWEEAVATYEMMVETYEYYGYNVIEVPKSSVEERVEFILKHIS